MPTPAQPAPEPSRANFQRFDEVADNFEFSDVALKPAERNALALLADSIGEVDMLDLGVGAGRTGYTFAPLVRSYVGLDVAPRMIERARKLLKSDEKAELLVGDARNLSELTSRPGFRGFDFILFSFNGLGAVGHEDRLKILREVRRAIAPGGLFLFSSHSIGALPLNLKRPKPPHLRNSRLYRLIAPISELRYAREARKSNQMLDLDAARKQGWVIVRDPAHDFTLDVYYVDPSYQVEQLREVGFEVKATYNIAGEEVTLPYAGRDPWLDYLCSPTDSPSEPESAVSISP